MAYGCCETRVTVALHERVGQDLRVWVGRDAHDQPAVCSAPVRFHHDEVVAALRMVERHGATVGHHEQLRIGAQLHWLAARCDLVDHT
eukprot:1672368-Prymnesium_polylepis.2